MLIERKKEKIIIEIMVLSGAIIFLLPIFFLFITSFKPYSEIINFQGIMPKQWTLENIKTVLVNSQEIPILRWFVNSLVVSTAASFLVLTVQAMAAFALSRLNLPGSKVLFVIIIATLMIPAQILLVPVYLILNYFGWLDNHLALIVPPAAGAFGVFLLRQFFVSIPREYEEAALIDGCSTWKIFWYIILPMSKPVLATLGIFVFIASWNDFLGPMVFLDSSDKYTLPVGIALFQNSYMTDYGITLAASSLGTLPVLIVFLLFQKYIIKGISLSGLKG